MGFLFLSDRFKQAFAIGSFSSIILEASIIRCRNRSSEIFEVNYFGDLKD
jgi:hypothetical protein